MRLFLQNVPNTETESNLPGPQRAILAALRQDPIDSENLLRAIYSLADDFYGGYRDAEDLRMSVENFLSLPKNNDSRKGRFLLAMYPTSRFQLELELVRDSLTMGNYVRMIFTYRVDNTSWTLPQEVEHYLTKGYLSDLFQCEPVNRNEQVDPNLYL